MKLEFNIIIIFIRLELHDTLGKCFVSTYESYLLVSEANPKLGFLNLQYEYSTSFRCSVMSKKCLTDDCFSCFSLVCAFPQRSVKMVVSMEEGVLLLTDVCVRTASPEPSVREVMSATQPFSTLPNTYPTVNSFFTV